jgi:1-deoxy-D-xylulose-5-phosphate reductoisomerase
LNAANEVAVGLFLEGRMSFLRIPELIDQTLEAHQRIEVESLEAVLEVDRCTREEALRLARQSGWVQV